MGLKLIVVSLVVGAFVRLHLGKLLLLSEIPHINSHPFMRGTA